jgi:hypothetical protein
MRGVYMKKLLLVILVSVLAFGCGDDSNLGGGNSPVGNVTVGIQSRMMLQSGGTGYTVNIYCTHPVARRSSVQVTVINKANSAELALLGVGEILSSQTPWSNLNNVQVETSQFFKTCTGTQGSGSTNHTINCGSGDISFPTNATLIFKCTDGNETDTYERNL